MRKGTKMLPVENFIPIELPDVNKITRKGYYIAEISDASFKVVDGKQILLVEFTIIKGKHTGFKLSTRFYESRKSQFRLGYLCDAVEIQERLNALQDLVGKQVKLRVVPNYSIFKGKLTVQYWIMRFHKAES